MNFCRTEIYAGTPLERQLRESGRLRGDYWGYDYRIADARAQESFSIAYAAFAQRCFGLTSLHHWAMRLDYEYHLLSRFFGRDESLRAQVKDFVQAVNLDTAERLAAIVAAVGAGIDDRDAFVARVKREVHDRDAELDAIGREILDALHDAAVEAPSGFVGPWAQRAAAAGLVAALSLGGPGCSGDDDGPTHYSETIPAPTEPVGEDPPATLIPIDPQPAPAPPAPVPAPDPVPELGDASAIRPEFNRRALRRVAREIQPPRDATVTLTLADDGSVQEASVAADGLDAARQARIADRLRRLRFTTAGVGGKRFVLSLTRAQIRAASTARLPFAPHPTEMAPPPTHFSEMAPPPTHFSEMAPPPTHFSEEAPMPGFKPDGADGQD